jgi:hypothetical protein
MNKPSNYLSSYLQLTYLRNLCNGQAMAKNRAATIKHGSTMALPSCHAHPNATRIKPWLQA